jgi:hypothetical protein
MIRGLFSLALLLVIGGAGAAYFAAQAQPQVGRDLPAVPASTEAAAAFDGKVLSVQAALDAAKTTGVAQPIFLEFTDAELTSKATIAVGSLTGGFIPTDPQIHVQPGNIVLTANLSLAGFTQKLAVTAIPVLVDGKPAFSIDQVETALPLPDGIKKEINAQIAKILSPETLGFAFEITKIEAHEGRLVFQGFAKP